MQLNRITPLCVALRLERFGGRTALLVDPDPHCLEARWLLLSGSYGPPQAACTPHEVFGLELDCEPEVVVLSDSLGSFQLQAVAEYVRHRWPRARILLVSQADPSLEDQLYDECVTNGFNPAEFLAAVERAVKVAEGKGNGAGRDFFRSGDKGLSLPFQEARVDLWKPLSPQTLEKEKPVTALVQ